MQLTIQKTGNGVNKDLLASELLPGQWSDCLNMRFRNEFAEKFRGIKAAYNVPTITPYWMETYISPTSRFVVMAGTAKAFCDDGVTSTEITRFAAGATVSNLTFVTTTATMTTAFAHGLTTGNTITVYGAFPLAYNGTFTITVTSATVFTYTMLSSPGFNGAPLGAYSLPVGVDFTGTRDDRLTGGVLNGVLLLNNPVDGLYYWNGDPATRLRKVPGADFIADVGRPFKNFVVFLAPTVAGVNRPHSIKWSKSAEPGAIPTAFVASTSNDAGDVDQAETPGWMVDCLPMGDVNIVYKQDARYSMQYIGGNDVFRFQRLPGNDGLLARNCVVNTPKGHVFLSNGDVKIHNGGEAVSIADGRIRKWLFNTMDSSTAGRSFLCLNPQKTEVWVCFPSLGKEECDTVAAWNWDSDTWGIRSAPNLTCAVTGLIAGSIASGSWASDTDSWESDITVWSENEFSQNESRLIVGTSAPRIGLAESGATDFGAPLPWTLERNGLALDDPESVKTFSASRPHLSGVSGTTVQIRHGSAMTPDATPVYAPPVDFVIGTTNWANSFASGGRYLSYKLSSASLQPVTLRSFDIDFIKQGRF